MNSKSKLQYQIHYFDDLFVIKNKEPKIEEIAEHFSNNGYRPLYILENDILKYVITFEDFTSNLINRTINREFIFQEQDISSRKDIISILQSNPSINFIVVINDGRLCYEIDSLVLLPYQNGT